MKRIPRVLLTAAGAAVMAIVTAAGASAAGFFGPGHSSSSGADAYADWYSTTPYVSVSVDRNTFVFRPSHHGGVATVGHMTLLFVTVQTDTTFESGCYEIPDSAFVESNGVQNASVNVTVDSPNLCEFGKATPVSDVLGDAGGGPPPGSDIPLPLTVNMTWAGNGVTSANTDTGRATCGGFNSENQDSIKSAIASATGTLSFGDGSSITLGPSDFGTVDQSSFQSNVQGYPNPLCYGI